IMTGYLSRSVTAHGISNSIRINVSDQYHQEKWCFRTALNHRIDDYISDTHYTAQEIDMMNDILAGIESDQKKFDVYVDFDQVRKDIAEALVFLDITEKNVKEEVIENIREEKVIGFSDVRKTDSRLQAKKKTRNIFRKLYLPMASGFAGVIVLGATALTAGVITSIADR
ncbi:MAG: hypothetical protein Q4B26_07425, partial [Eubacteriales bacterium]|nr:hypothetical protein [Eubacteriales bacterium]